MSHDPRLKRTARSAWLALLAGGCISSFMVNANDLQRSETVEKTIIKQAAKAQTDVSDSSDHSQQLKAEIEALEAEVASLEVYQHHLDGLVENQQQELSSIELQLVEIEQTKRSVIPLMYAMLKDLEDWIVQDAPIRQQSRMERLEKLQLMMKESAVSDAEKYRRILEAYQIELDYGIKLGSHLATIEIDGEPRNVEQLYLGRVSLVARSLDQQQFWVWSRSQNLWQTIGRDAGIEINKAFALANQQVSPSLITLPVSVSSASTLDSRGHE